MRTPSQTVGPFFHIGLCDRPANALADDGIRLSGRVFDGAGAPVSDALVELWHPDVGFGRCATDDEGGFEFTVARPADGHFEVMIFARGLLKPVLTRLYVPGEAAEDETMVAGVEGDGLRFDVHLQGERETAFFEL
jgi:protocatechuate 3,4-dioxygenase, alpha subunit